jgi:hypothetical protein
MSKELFAAVPEFMAAFTHILKNGFFEDIQLSVSGKMMEGKISGCFINATGCVPNDAKYDADGCGGIIDPEAVIASCREMATEQKVSNVTTKVETNDWLLYDDEGEVIGSKGSRTELSICILFEM